MGGELINKGDQSRASVQLWRNKFAHYLSFLRDYSPVGLAVHCCSGGKQISRFTGTRLREVLWPGSLVLVPTVFVSRIR